MNRNQKENFALYNHLGTDYPYYFEGENAFNLNFQDLYSQSSNESLTLDITGVIEVVNKGFLLSNRTLIKGLKRSPWLGKPDETKKSWIYASLPKHGELKIETNEIAKSLKEKLKMELINYIYKKSTVGILLSGGLDSRIVAGLLRELQLKGEYLGSVIAITWGIDNSRDVVYAKHIAKKYKWEWLHLPLNAEKLGENIGLTGKLGAEFSPLHMHAMNEVRKLNNVDAIIAGSYGDGVGRAEFSGKHILNLPATVSKNINKFGIIKNELINESKQEIYSDAYNYREHIQRKEEYQYREIEHELHYMRRKLQSSMSYISEKIPVYQMFTSPETFGFMWSLDPTTRKNEVYEKILLTLPDGVSEIPWARNGITNSTGIRDHYKKNHHQYGEWLRNDLYETVYNLVTHERLMDLNIFNEGALSKLIKIWPNSNTVSTNQIDEIISWLASFSVFIDVYKPTNSSRSEKSYKDFINEYKGYSHARMYQIARDIKRE